MRYAWLIAVTTAFGCSEFAFGQDADDAIREEILRVYSFSPHELTKEEQAEKSKTLDVFWQKAKEQPKVYVPVFQSQLKTRDVPPFFLYDGSMLLLKLADTAENRRIVLQAIARCDLRDVQRTDYFRQVHRLATLGENTTEAAFHILDYPKFQAFIPQHSLTLGQNYSLIYMLFPTDPAYWLDPAIKRVAVEADPIAQKSLLLLLWYAQTADAHAAIADFAAAPDKPAANRDFAKGLQGRKGKAATAEVTDVKQAEEKIRKKRRELMRLVSDESLHELEKQTWQLMELRRGGNPSKE